MKFVHVVLIHSESHFILMCSERKFSIRYNSSVFIFWSTIELKLNCGEQEKKQRKNKQCVCIFVYLSLHMIMKLFYITIDCVYYET
jgi:hypothetical protein